MVIIVTFTAPIRAVLRLVIVMVRTIKTANLMAKLTASDELEDGLPMSIILF